MAHQSKQITAQVRLGLPVIGIGIERTMYRIDTDSDTDPERMLLQFNNPSKYKKTIDSPDINGY